MDPSISTQPVQNETPIFQSSLQQPPVEKSPQLKSKFKLIVLIIILLILVAGVAYYFGTKQNNFFTLNQKPTPTIMQFTSTPTPDPTANWKTYENSLGNYEIRYPDNWDVVDVGVVHDGEPYLNENNPTITNIMLYPLYAKNDPYSIRDGIFIEVNKTRSDTLLEDYLNSQKWFNSDNFKKFETVKINNIEARKGELMGSQYSVFNVIYFKNGPNVYSIDYRINKAVNVDENIFNQILSTLKFIDQNQQRVTPTPTQSAPSLTLCSADFSESPAMANFAQTAVKLCNDNYLKIKQKLGDDRPQIPILLVFKKIQANPGETLGYAINLSSDWFTKNPDDLGAIIHEMAHVFQGYPGGSIFWLQEGIADYIRYWDGYKNSWSYAHCGPGSENYTSGYWCSAAFIQYLERTYDSNIIAKLNGVLREGNYSDSTFTQYTGKDLPSLWAECKNSDCAGGS